MIRVRELSYAYPQTGRRALHNVNLTIHPGEFVLLSGPSGSGKSTLLRALNGLVPHFNGGTISGQIEVCSLSPLEDGPQRLSMLAGFVSQSPENQAVLDKVEPDIAFAMENAALAPDEMRRRMSEILNIMDLVPLRERKLSTLSGGERQRVAIAAALVLRPKLLLLDEPTSQLDPQAAEAVLGSLARLKKELGLTIILAEHRLERLLGVVDRMIYLDSGRIVSDGPVPTVMAQFLDGPPLIELGRALNWQPLPLTLEEAKPLADALLPAQSKTTVGRSNPRRRDNEHTAVEVKDLCFAYKGSSVLHNISFDLARGEALAILGRNGSGKSTLLRCMMGLLKQQRGQVFIHGLTTDGRAVHQIARQVAYLPQNPDDLLFAETVAQEAEITLKNHGRADPAAIDSWLEQFELQSVAEHYPRDLSVGQRQRVALAAVTVTNPHLLLLDEPTRGLDARLKESLAILLRQWLGQGRSLVLVTHDVELAAQVADRVLILDDGRISQQGSLVDILPSTKLYATQMSRLFPGKGWLTKDDALHGLSRFDETNIGVGNA